MAGDEASDEVIDLSDEVVDLLGRRLDEFFQRTAVAGVPTEVVSRFRDLVDAQPFEVFTEAFAYLDGRFSGWRSQLPRFDSPADLQYLQEVERWNAPGLALLRPPFANLAEVLYERLLSDIRSLQAASSTRLHKGTPYHMLGISRVLQENLESAHDYFVLAAFEDALLDDENWQGAPAAAMLAANWNGPVELAHVGDLARRATDYNEQFRDIVVWNPELLLMLESAV